jgi:hypothetical protein
MQVWPPLDVKRVERLADEVQQHVSNTQLVLLTRWYVEEQVRAHTITRS